MLEKSQEYEKRLREVRKMPDSENKREAARLFRMEALLDNASLAKLLTQRLEMEPTTSEERFRELAYNSGKIIHPEVAELFIKELVDVRDRTFRAAQDLKRDANFKHQGVGKELYRWALSQGDWEIENVVLRGKVAVNRGAPLALILFVEDEEDFKKIDPRNNIGGFYRPSAFYTTQPSGYQGEVIRPFPLIVVKGHDPDRYAYTRSQATVEHEQGHGEHQEFVSSLQHAEKKCVWGRFERPWNWQTKTAELARLTDQPPEKIRENSAYVQVLQYALAHAKDELLAEYKVDYRNFHKYAENLKKKGGLYDYFNNHLKIAPNSPAYDLLWQDYGQTIDEALASVKPIITTYDSMPYGMGVRADLFRWVLAQVPLENWKKQIEGSSFLEEAKLLQEIVNEIVEVFHQHGLDSPVGWKIDKLFSNLLRHQHKPVFQEIAALKSELKIVKAGQG